MYYCENCGSEFDTPDRIVETHRLREPPYEVFYVCPHCNSCDYHQRDTTHCHCCGAKLPENRRDYCSDDCRRKGERLWKAQQSKRKHTVSHPLSVITEELEQYNREHGTKYSYGQYVALIRPKQKGEKPCAKPKKNT